MVNQWRRGAYKERELLHKLEKEGFFVTRSAASLGVWDLIAINEKEVRLIQVKRTKGRLSWISMIPVIEREKMLKFKCPPCCKKQIWIWRDYKEWEIIDL